MPPWNWIIAAVTSRAVSLHLDFATETDSGASGRCASSACAAYQPACSAIRGGTRSGPGRVRGVPTGGLGHRPPHVQVGERVLQRLERADRLAERLTRLVV